MKRTLLDLMDLNFEARILWLELSSPHSERLQEIGFHPGRTVRLVARAPLGGPRVYQVGSTLMALRHEEAECAVIELLP